MARVKEQPMLPLKQHLQTELFEGTVRLARILFWRSMPYTLLFILVTGLLLLYPLGSLFGVIGLEMKELKSGINGDFGEFIRTIKKAVYHGDGLIFTMLLFLSTILRDIFVAAPIFRKLQRSTIADIEKDSIYDKPLNNCDTHQNDLRKIMILFGIFSFFEQLINFSTNIYLSDFSFILNFLYLVIAMKFAASPGFVIFEGANLATATKESYTRMSWFSALKCALMFYLTTILGAIMLFFSCLFVAIAIGVLAAKAPSEIKWLVHTVNGLAVFSLCFLFINTCICVVNSFMTTLYYRLSHDPD